MTLIDPIELARLLTIERAYGECNVIINRISGILCDAGDVSSDEVLGVEQLVKQRDAALARLTAHRVQAIELSAAAERAQGWAKRWKAAAKANFAAYRHVRARSRSSAMALECERERTKERLTAAEALLREARQFSHCVDCHTLGDTPDVDTRELLADKWLAGGGE